ncbi:MAG: peptidyl-prolyl cis-trans isomerase, EpsD family [Burkholderiales bacterium PBB6]|nr:MAG: peptidyl-prolyl cis-trans isomerase, EpsD family [Burkholderiales bacterium PBB6]
MKSYKMSASRSAAMALGVVASVVLIGCGGSKDKAATQAAARVNSGEITVHQINQALQQQRGLAPEQTEAVSRQLLERLIDQELAVQKAEELKLDRQPQVVAAIEAAKRDIIARAYGDKVAESVAKPTPDEVQKYFNDTPALFSNRRIYNLQEFNVQVPEARMVEAQARLQATKSTHDVQEVLKALQLPSSNNAATQPAEALPLSLVAKLGTLADGQSLVLPLPGGLKVVNIASSKSEPVTLEQARPAIELFLSNDRKRNTVAADIKALRTAAKVEYLGKFAEKAADAASGANLAQPAPAPTAATPAAPSATPASGGLDEATLKKGLGIK